MSSLVKVAGPSTVTQPTSSAELWLGGQATNIPSGTACASSLVATAAPSASPPGFAKLAEIAPALSGTEEPAEETVILKLTEESLRQDLEKFKDLLRRKRVFFYDVFFF